MEILSTKDVSSLLKIRRWTVYKLVKNNQLPAFRVGNRWRYKKEEIEEWIEKQKHNTVGG